MGKERGGVEQTGLERVQAAMAAWRGRKRARERIPVSLWQAAVRESKRYSVTRVCRDLRLNYAELKRRTLAVVEPATPLREPRQAFREISPGPVAMGTGCVVELEKPNGTRLRVSVPGYAGVDWSQLKAAFLEA